MTFPMESFFSGHICYGVSGASDDVDFAGKSILIIGGGAFAAENARTAIEKGASKVVVLSRRRGSVMPALLDYLNFAHPYSQLYSRNPSGSRGFSMNGKNRLKCAQ